MLSPSVLGGWQGSTWCLQLRGPYQLQPYNTTSFVLLQHFRVFSANMINIFEINLGNNKVALNAYKWLWVSKQKNCIVIVLCCHCQSPRYSQLLQPSNDFVGIFWNCGQMFVSNITYPHFSVCKMEMIWLKLQDIHSASIHIVSTCKQRWCCVVSWTLLHKNWLSLPPPCWIEFQWSSGQLNMHVRDPHWGCWSPRNIL